MHRVFFLKRIEIYYVNINKLLYIQIIIFCKKVPLNLKNFVFFIYVYF